MLSDDSSVDSDSGIRFKTESTRNKEETSTSRSDGHPSGRDRRGPRPHSRDRDNRNRRLTSPRRRDSPRHSNPRNDRQHRHERRHSPARRRSPVRARHESPRRQSPKRQSLKRESPRRHSLKRESPSRHSLKRESPRRLSLKRESPSRHSLKRESPRRLSLKRESPRRESLKRDSPRQHLKDSSQRNRHGSPRQERLQSPPKPIRNHSPKKSASPVKCTPPPRVIIDTTKDLRDKLKRKPSPIVELDVDAEPQPTSYYNQVFEDSTETINIDSSEDEMVLHSRLLALESVLSQTKEKKRSKHKEKKHKKSKSRRSDEESQKAEVVSSTTDIQVDLISPSVPDSKEAESSEEGEILSDGSSMSPSDLRRLITWKKPPLPDSSLKNPDDSEAMAVSGPALPPHLEKKSKNDKNMSNGVEGPALPPHMKQGDSKGKSIGPTLTEEMRKSLAKQPAELPDDASSPSEASEAEDIGPLPEGLKHKWTKAHESLEERALAIKIGKIDSSSKSGEDVKSREEWMLELPSAKAKEIGLGPRQFRAREAPDMTDRSSWTDTPKEKALKAAGVLPEKEVTNSESLKAEAQRRYIAERDEEHAQVIKKHKKKHNRDMSLLEQHEKK